MTSTAFAPPRGATERPQAADSPPITAVAARAARHHLHTAWRAVAAFGGAIVSVVVLGEYADGQ